MSNTGWQCPGCGTLYAPHITSCEPCTQAIQNQPEQDGPDPKYDEAIKHHFGVWPGG